MKSLPNPDKPADAFAAVSSLRVLADQFERSTVKEAIAQGWGWRK